MVAWMQIQKCMEETIIIMKCCIKYCSCYPIKEYVVNVWVVINFVHKIYIMSGLCCMTA